MMHHNKNRVGVEFFFLFLIMLFGNRVCGQMTSFKDVEIKSVSANTTSIVSISCDRFDSIFPPEACKVKYITDSTTLESFRELLQSLKFQTGEPKIDVRTKFYFHFEDNNAAPIVICASKFFEIVVNGKEIRKNRKGNRKNKTLVDLLRKIKDGVDYK